MNKRIDARSLPCPKPVILTKHAIDEADFTTLEILVDNEAAKENVKRFLTKQGFADIAVNSENGDYSICVGGQRVPSFAKEQLSDKTLFLSSQYIGSGDDTLGTLLMRGFLYTLTELDQKPSRMIFMNSAVYLTIEPSQTLTYLQKLQHDGVEIMVCGTCLDYYQVKEQLAVGIISNMYSITEALLQDTSPVKIS